MTHTRHSKSGNFSTLRSLLRPIIAVGVKANDRKWERGNQNQNWVKTSRPTIEGMWVWPVLDCREMVTLRPPEQQREEEFGTVWQLWNRPTWCWSFTGWHVSWKEIFCKIPFSMTAKISATFKTNTKKNVFLQIFLWTFFWINIADKILQVEPNSIPTLRISSKPMLINCFSLFRHVFTIIQNSLKRIDACLSPQAFCTFFLICNLHHRVLI